MLLLVNVKDEVNIKIGKSNIMNGKCEKLRVLSLITSWLLTTIVESYVRKLAERLMH